ncbi:DMT family transporter [Sporomusa termitida]|uniref:2A78: carboxylate/amino acid/amine transporter n=1 Tax=Sporomusa termitida TaxID=2377 RepID=A0A517DYC0_9FIRM|nr:DMT family transporter [Sporomusa termitida]QDR82350.1 2A78: carboxylate/amino acid/amine transporter [Sporomusa termitida]
MKQARINQIIGISCVNLATLLWASNIALGRLLKDSIGPITISSARFLIASLIFAVILRQQPPADRQAGKDWPLLAAMALTGIVLFSPILYWGLHYTTAVNSTIINGLAPLLTGLFATWLIKEPMSKRQIGGAILALIGVLVLISGGSLAFWQTAQFNRGDLIILIAVAVWGLYSVISSRVMRYRSSISATAFSMFIGLPVLCLLAGVELQRIPVSIDAGLLLITVYLGIVPAAIGFYAWNAGVARLGPSGAMVFYNTLPLYGALLGALFLDEAIGSPHIIGGLFIICGGIWAARKQPAVGSQKLVAEKS